MAIPITGKFAPSDGAHGFKLYDVLDIDTGTLGAGVIWTLGVGGRVTANGTNGEIVVQTGAITPVHAATEGTLYWDTVAHILYGSQGGGAWTALSGGASGYSGYSGVGTSGYSGYSGRSGYSGYSGPSGISGYSGYSGPSGYSGYSGPSGYSGYSGPSGISGYSGYSGPSGISGYSGYSGPSGYSGYSGPSGYSGYSGKSGYSGYSGPSGYSGYSGPSGISGYSGYSGPSGYSGYSGPSGISGYSGYSGPSGYSGYSGPSGISGYSGYSGPSGYSGYSGPSGISGYSGYSGPSGYSGYSGPSGISGYSGYSGPSGYSGYSGKSGYSGYSGPSGYSGYSGPSGISGYSGYSGPSGISGYSGYSGSGVSEHASLTTTAHGGIVAASPLSMTWTGTWQYPFPFSLLSGWIVGAGSSATASYGVGINGFAYAETATMLGGLTSLSFDNVVYSVSFSTVSMLYITSWSFPALQWVSGQINANTFPLLTSLTFPELLGTGNNFNCGIAANLTTLSIPKLATVGGIFGPNTLASLATLSAPALTTVGAAFTPGTAANLTTFNFPSLATVGGNFAPTTMASLTSISLDSLAYVGGNFAPAAMASLTTLSAPALVTCLGTCPTITTGFGNITDLTIGTVGTTKKIGGNFTCTGQKLNTSSVSQLLGVLASLDGTNGTTAYSSLTVNISGGTNAAPTFTGTSQTSAGSNFVGSAGTATASVTGHGFVNGDLITITGITGTTGLNGTYYITRVNDNQFTYSCAATGTGAGTATMKKAGSQVSTSITGQSPDATHATIVKSSHGYYDGQVVSITNATPSGFNGVYKIIYVDTDTFKIVNSTSGTASVQGNLSTDGYRFAQYLLLRGCTVTTN